MFLHARPGQSIPATRSHPGRRISFAFFFGLVGLIAAGVVARPQAQAACPCSIWSATATPVSVVNDPNAVELGVKFRADSNGYITGLRFYKYSQNTGTHVGNLWSSTGTLLGTVTFSNETASGWQQATFPSPIAISAATTYVASYHTNTGYYAATSGGLTAGVD